ncbi:flagellar assembly protein FliH [Formivibrio citricus]|uniref:Flagellar assembly protein FliH n=1 Tax=Formivibrio citricus TaxID=83765 RepID=A0A1I5B9C9_9NEIS|nr:flagellar assembly protein FliH [Formivibrio citricus]SFN71287.1 flagellar assembly protein FliH [Formivibrio citricus]
MAGSNTGRVIPREELSDFQRWQFSSLLETPVSPVREEAQPQSVPEEVLPEPVPDLPSPVEEAFSVLPESGLALPTAEEIEAIERQAQEEGYQTGLAAGRLAAESEVNRLRALLGDMEAACKDVETRIANDVLDLALMIARQMVREEVRADRTRVFPLIREAVAGLPAVKGPSRLLLNPEDLTAVNVLLAGELSGDYWRLAPDPTLPPGSCRIETPDSSVDLTMTARWRNLLRVLGRNRHDDLDWREEDAPFASGSHVDAD